jgi:hypothetical protein
VPPLTFHPFQRSGATLHQDMTDSEVTKRMKSQHGLTNCRARG